MTKSGGLGSNPHLAIAPIEALWGGGTTKWVKPILKYLTCLKNSIRVIISWHMTNKKLNLVLAINGHTVLTCLYALREVKRLNQTLISHATTQMALSTLMSFKTTVVFNNGDRSLRT